MIHIEAVYYAHFVVYAEECDSIEDAVSYLSHGDDEGWLASVGVFIDGEPNLTDVYVTEGGRPPTEDEAAAMRADYAKVRPACGGDFHSEQGSAGRRATAPPGSGA